MHKTRIRIPTLKKASLVMVNLLRWCFLDGWKHLPPLWTAMETSNKNERQTEKYRQRNGMRQIAESLCCSGNEKIMGWSWGMKSSHAVYLRYRMGGGKTPARFRRFSSSTPTRLAEGLGPKRLSIANWRYAPETWVPRSRCFFGIRHIRNIFIP